MPPSRIKDVKHTDVYTALYNAPGALYDESARKIVLRVNVLGRCTVTVDQAQYARYLRILGATCAGRGPEIREHACRKALAEDFVPRVVAPQAGGPLRRVDIPPVAVEKFWAVVDANAACHDVMLKALEVALRHILPVILNAQTDSEAAAAAGRSYRRVARQGRGA